MNSAGDRRAPGATRIPFDGMVEVGGALGPAFEAQALNLSEEGMSLRTAYLPEVGQPIRCRFEAGHGLSVMAAGEVLWNEDLGEGGEFGVRFTNLDAQSTVALQRIMGMAEEGILPRPPHGKKVRLHIEGLASPMRARLRGTQATCATAYSELGFLEMGKPLELEDAMSGSRRPALIDKVDVAMEEGSRIPQLVVTLRYDDEEARMAARENEHAGSLSAVTIEEQTGRDEMSTDPQADEEMPMEHGEEDEMVPAPAPGEEAHAEAKAMESDSPNDEIDAESEKLKSPLARTAAKITPAMMSFAKRAKVTMALLAAKIAARRGGSGDDVEIPMRRTTAPAPGGGLHASGRKVIRGEIGEDKADEDEPKPKFKITKRRAAVAGAIGVAGILAMFAMHKPAPAPQLAATPPVETATSAPPAAAPAAPAGPAVNDPLASQAMAGMPGANGMMSTGMGKNGKPAPFTNGSVGAHGNVIRIKMDGQIAAIQGASQPTGFTVVIPSRKSMDAAGPLASKDPRIAALKVANEPTGAELSVTFKDGVPNYAVRAKGDVLELVLAKASANGDKPAEAKAGHAGAKKKKKH
jgi:hypothetical protein